MDTAVITLKNVYYRPERGKELEEKDMRAAAGLSRAYKLVLDFLF